MRYAQSNVPKLFHLRKEIAHLTQSSLSISAYFTKFRTLHDELECLYTKPRCTCNHCTCSVNGKLNELDQSVQLTQFLMGLNDTFTGVRDQILMMKPLPSLNQCYAMLLQEESQCEVHNSLSFTTDNVAMSVKSNFSTNQYVRGAQSSVRKSNDVSVVCDYCHMSGHLKDKCYCIHGYPSWHQLFGKPKPKPKLLTPRNSVVANVIQTSTENSSSTNKTMSVGSQFSTSDGLNLSESQCKQLISMLQRNLIMTSQPSSTSQSEHFVDSGTPAWMSSINTVKFSGMTTHAVNQVHKLDKSVSQFKWIIDTDATDHITPFFHLLQDVSPCNATLQLPNDATAVISHIGRLVLSPFLTLTGVLYVPSFAYNLLFISKLLQDTSYQVTLLASKCYLQGKDLHKSLELGKEEDGLYMLTSKPISSVYCSSEDTLSSAIISATEGSNYLNNTFVAQVHTTDIWHARIGHAPANIINMFPIPGTKKVLDVCDSCFFAKQSRLKFPISVTTSAHLFDLVHADLWGPYCFKTHSSCTMFLTLVEDLSRTTWVYLLSTKTVVPMLIQEFFTLI